MSRLQPITTVFAVLTLATLAWASQSDEVAEQSDAPPAEAPIDEESDFPEDAAEFPEDSSLQDLPEPKYRRPVGDDLKARLFQLLQRELQRKMGEKRGNAPHPRDLRRAIEQQLRDQVMEFEQSGKLDAALQFGRREVEHASHHQGVHGRLEHMQAAMHHLHAADLHEMAEIVEEQADAIRRVAQAQQEHVHLESPANEHAGHQDDRRAPRERGHDKANPQLHGILRELMEQVELLRTDVIELREQVEAIRNE
jgi:hypothetical protein